MIIYMIKNLINGKSYIGQTAFTLEKRFQEHKIQKKGSRLLKTAFKKYGIENFEITEIAKANSRSELNELEIKYIKSYNTLSPNGYNLNTGGSVFDVSEETKILLSTIRKGMKFSETHRKNISKGRKGLRHSNETRVKMSVSRKGRPHSKEWNKKVSEANKGRKFTAEHKEKLSLAKLNKKRIS